VKIVKEEKMPVKIEQLPGESIVHATVHEPFVPERDMPAMFAEIIPLRMTIQGDVALIIDFSATTNHPNSFSKMVFTLAEAAQGIKAGRAAGVSRPPILIFVGTGPIADIASQAIEQEQYGGVKGHLCASQDEALALARAKLSA
jgi:hypothetical protein